MKYNIKREGETVCIGHCSEVIEANELTLNRCLKEIQKRLRARLVNEADDGITFRREYFGDLELFDEITISTETEAVTMVWGFPVSQAKRRPLTVVDDGFVDFDIPMDK